MSYGDDALITQLGLKQLVIPNTYFKYGMMHSIPYKPLDFENVH